MLTLNNLKVNYHHYNMKADIPDSIIISRDEDGVLHHSYWTTDQQLVPFEATEFIRKGALLEWAEDVKAKTGWYEIEVAMDDLIDKLNSMCYEQESRRKSIGSISSKTELQ